MSNKFMTNKANYKGQNYSNRIHTTYKMIHDKKTGEEKLVKKDEIDILEQMKEQQAIVEEFKEIALQQIENQKAENLIDKITNEEFMKELEIASNSLQDENIYSMMDKMQNINRIFNNLPKEQREKYKTPVSFAKEGLKDFIKESKTKVERMKNFKIEEETKNIEETNEMLEKQIEELQNKLKGNTNETKQHNTN